MLCDLLQHLGTKGHLQKDFMNPEESQKCELREYCAYLCIGTADSEYRDIRYSERISILLSFSTEYLYRDITLDFRISFRSMPAQCRMTLV